MAISAGEGILGNLPLGTLHHREHAPLTPTLPARGLQPSHSQDLNPHSASQPILPAHLASMWATVSTAEGVLGAPSIRKRGKQLLRHITLLLPPSRKEPYAKRSFMVCLKEGGRRVDSGEFWEGFWEGFCVMRLSKVLPHGLLGNR